MPINTLFDRKNKYLLNKFILFSNYPKSEQIKNL